jgi:DNA polymerase (family 10)
MQNQRVAELLNKIADLLEIEEESVYRVGAYRTAARQIESLAESIEAIDERGALEEIPGVGESIAAKIREFLHTGRLAYLDRLEKEVPAAVVALTEVPGIGPRRARLIHERLGITTLPQLQTAAQTHRLCRLPGFGEKMERNLLRVLATQPKPAGRLLLTQALPPAEEIVAVLRNVPQALQVEIAGSLRRFKETIGDVDLLAAAREPEPVMAAFVQLPSVRRVLAHGSTRSSVVLEDGLQVDLRVVAPESFGAALQYFTGSKAHNIKLREWAEQKGLKISEYGVFTTRTGERVAGTTEEEVYVAVDLPWIPPELREDAGELEAARDGRLPVLVSLDEIRGDLHCHTRASDGLASLEEMAEAAAARGYAYLAVTDHSQGLGIARGLSSARLRRQHSQIDALNRRLPGLQVLRGIEVNIRADGSLDAAEEDLAACEVVVASLHSGLDQDRARLTARVLRAIEHPCVNIIGHPTGRSLGRRPAADLDMEAVIAAAARTGTALEINAMPDRLDLCDTHARLAAQRGAPLVIDTDAHSPAHLTLMRLGVATARRGWVAAANVWNTLPLPELRRRLAAKRGSAA